ncbi:MAG: C40 family peptidase, partial [Eubacterium sp.]|nr:C40 family peptidase [Eubacterium sp.]
VIAASNGQEEGVSGAVVVIDNYCEKVAEGSLQATDPVLLINGDTIKSELSVEEEVATGPATEIESAIREGEHVNLNLNYSRLGIADKVSNYLNVRKEPKKSARIVGKMVKNSGCHIYNVKKGWAKIVSGKVKGYVKAEYLTMDEDAEAIAPEVGRDCVEIMKEDVDEAFLQKIIDKEKISDEAIERAGGIDYLLEHMNEFICIMVDDDYAFVSKEYVREQFSLKRATVVKIDPETGEAPGSYGIVAYAMQFLGNPYVWGGTSLTNGCDCSGFTMQIWAHFGKGLPHSSAAQAGCTTSVSNPIPGDLFFYGSGGVSHVAMYIGGGQVIHASNHRDGIKISNAYYRHPLKIGRP